jgi:hypothetical protein
VSVARGTSNKAVIRRLLDAMNTGDADLVAQTIDEVFEPDVKQHGPFEVTGTQARWWSQGSIRPSPTFTLRSTI